MRTPLSTFSGEEADPGAEPGSTLSTFPAPGPRIPITERRSTIATGQEETRGTGAAADAAEARERAAVRQAWALGNYHRFATRTVWELGPLLVNACGITPGQRVLDVAAGSGNVAIRAAEAGARVVAADLTPENFEAGRREAALRGVELEWREADARSLPFEDGEFDVVTSLFGALFAPHHGAVAGEMLRVCRPGGTIGMINSAPKAAPRPSSSSWGATRRRPRQGRPRPSSGGWKTTCAASSATGSPAWR